MMNCDKLILPSKIRWLRVCFALACAWIATTSTTAFGELTRKPYLQNVGKTSAT